MMTVETDTIEQFREAMAAAGLTPPDHIEADGSIHRCSSNGKSSDMAGWYCLHLDGVPAGSFGDWRQGYTQTWCGKDDNAMTPAERDAHRQRIKAMQAQRDAERQRQQQEAQQAAAQRWEQASPCTGHPYLTRKGVQAYVLRQNGNALLVPLRDTTGALHSLQSITADGSKRFHVGGRVTGCYHAIGKPAGVIVVCEGYATGASIHEATGHAVAVAFNAGNLQAVAQALHERHPGLQIIVAADDDHATPGNPGLTKANDAAKAVGGRLAVPAFADRPAGATDFNDLHQLQGLEDVRACIEAAALPNVADAENWPDPEPLPCALPAVLPFDLELLPHGLRWWVGDISYRMQQPPDFAAVGAVVALSSLIGARAVIQPKRYDDWRVVPVLWGLIAGRPGSMKSPTLSEVMKPLSRLEANEREQWKAEHDAWKLDCRVADLQAAASESEAKKVAIKDPARARHLLTPVEAPPEPRMRRFVVNDATVEKLGELLTANPWGLVAFRDELHGLLAGMDKQGQEGARAFYLQAYDGNQGYTFDRIGRGETTIPRVCLALLGGIQPARLQEYVRSATSGGAGDDGLLQRFGMAVWPDAGRDFRIVDQHPSASARQDANAVFDRLAKLEPLDDEPEVWRFDDEAQTLFYEWWRELETELRSGELHVAMESHLSKYRKLIPALALVFALVDTPDAPQTVGAAELLRAFAWGDYLRSHATRVYAAATQPDSAAADALLVKIRQGKVTDGFKLKQVQQNGWAWLSTTEDVKRAAAMLEEYGWVRCIVTPAGEKGGRPAETWAINPKAEDLWKS